MNITLEIIKAEQTRLSEMIAAFEAQASKAFLFPETQIDLRPGEHYAGLIIGKDGEPSHHLILLADTPTDDLSWQAAMDWAKRVGGELPTRREQALLYANCKEQFEAAWCWSSEQHASYSHYAWVQTFGNGNQNVSVKSAERRARAVRRFPI
jgi:hypothetical protein